MRSIVRCDALQSRGPISHDARPHGSRLCAAAFPRCSASGTRELGMPNRPGSLQQYPSDYFVAQATNLCEPSRER
uniref:Uncharacterized protein n=1 Tax=Bradyrhizobium amphicarpaeae TaxID=1404768 RepID=A0A2U8Q1B8_9BRAD|nr:hypothetical protein CIT40_30210 [Bradyrhizobium amphicarpaeae]